MLNGVCVKDFFSKEGATKAAVFFVYPSLPRLSEFFITSHTHIEDAANTKKLKLSEQISQKKTKMSLSPKYFLVTCWIPLSVILVQQPGAVVGWTYSLAESRTY